MLLPPRPLLARAARRPEVSLAALGAALSLAAACSGPSKFAPPSSGDGGAAGGTGGDTSSAEVCGPPDLVEADLSASACNPPIWARVIGDPDAVDVPWGVAAAPNGGAVVLSYRMKSGAQTIHLLRYSENGNLVDETAADVNGQVMPCHGSTIAARPDGAIFYCIRLQGTVKSPELGEQTVLADMPEEVSLVLMRRWPAQDGTPADAGFSGTQDSPVAEDDMTALRFAPSGDLFMASSHTIPTFPPEDGRDVTMVRYHYEPPTQGTPAFLEAPWSSQFGLSGGQGVAAIDFDPAGRVLAAGFAVGSSDFGGGPLSAAADDSGALLLVLDADGTHVHSALFLGDRPLAAEARGVTVLPNGGVAMAGTIFTSVDFGGGPLSDSPARNRAFFAAFDADYHHVASRAYGAPTFQTDLTGFARIVPGENLLAGHHRKGDCEGDFLAVVDDAGAPKCTSLIALDEPLTYVASANNGAYILTSIGQDGIDLGGGKIVSTGAGRDVVLAKLGP